MSLLHHFLLQMMMCDFMQLAMHHFASERDFYMETELHLYVDNCIENVNLWQSNTFIMNLCRCKTYK